MIVSKRPNPSGSSASPGVRLSRRRRLLRPGNVNSGVSTAVSSSKVQRFFTVTATTLSALQVTTSWLLCLRPLSTVWVGTGLAVRLVAVWSSSAVLALAMGCQAKMHRQILYSIGLVSPYVSHIPASFATIRKWTFRFEVHQWSFASAHCLGALDLKFASVSCCNCLHRLVC